MARWQKNIPADELTEAWKKITFNQFHDLAAGSGIGIIYKDAQSDYDQVRWATNEISARRIEDHCRRAINTSAAQGVPVLVFNPLAWERSGLVTVNVQLPDPTDSVSVLDSEGSRSSVADSCRATPATHTFKLLIEVPNVPSMGYEVLHVVPGARPSQATSRPTGLLSKTPPCVSL